MGRNVAYQIMQLTSRAASVMSTPELTKRVPAPATKGSRRKRKRTDENLDEAERVRRQLQRQKQELALKLRAEGKSYKPQKSAKSSTKAESALSAPKHAPTQSQPRQQQQQSVHQRPESGTRPEGPIQVIIVPIFWNKKADEKETVIAAAQHVLQQLQEVGIEAGLDDTNADTPGQKYRYWEQKGVKVRIELGPRDAHKSQACLAISITPGKVAKKVTYQLGTELTRAVQGALAAAGTLAASQPGDALKAKSDSSRQKKPKSDQKPTAENSKPASQPGMGDNSHVSADGTSSGVKDVQTPLAVSAKSKASKHKLPSGDDLGDEFPVEMEDAEDVGKKKKKKPVITPSLVSTAATPAKGKKSKHKLVSF